MRFVSPETVRITLKNGDWIEVKKELTVGDEKRLLSSGFKRASPGSEQIEVDWFTRSIARVEIYLTGWSAVDDKGRPVAITRDAIETLSSEDFDVIDDAIKTHQAAVDAEKKARSMTPTSTLA